MYLIITVAIMNGSRPCLLGSNLSSYGLPYLIPSFCVKPASCGSHSLQTVVPDELFHFVQNKLRHGERIHSRLFNYYWSRRVLPEVLFITAGSCQYTPLIPLRGVIGQARHSNEASNCCTHKVDNTVRTSLLMYFLIFLTYIL